MIELVNKNELKTFIGDSSEKLNKVNKKINGKWVAGTYIPTMSTFKEIDTGKTYVFNKNGGNTYIYRDGFNKKGIQYHLGDWIEVDSIPKDIKYACIFSDLSKFNNDMKNRKLNNTDYIKNGTKCFTLDSKKVYVFNEKTNKWVENKFKETDISGSGSSGSSVTTSNIVDLVLFMGQSNMSGQGEDATKATVLEEGEGYEFRAVSDPTKLYKAVEPFGVTENNTAITDSKTGGMITSIMKSYYESRKIPMVGISASYGGSGIDQWQPNTTFYNEAVRRANLAKTWLIDNGYVIEHTYMVWCQGEHEGNLGKDYRYYRDNLFNVFNGLQSDVGVEKCFIVRIGNKMGSNDVFKSIIDAQTKITQYYQDYILATTKLSEMNDRGLMRTTYHFVQSAYNEIGLDVGKNIAYYFNNNKKPFMYDYLNDNLYFSYETNRGYNGGIAVNGVSLDKKTITIKPTLGNNLFNSSTVDTSNMMDNTNGLGAVSNARYSYIECSDYIEVEVGKTYRLSHNNVTVMGVWFDSNKQGISAFTGLPYDKTNTPVDITAPANAKYVRFNINTNKTQLSDVYFKEVFTGNTTTLTATITPDNASNKNVTFKSSDKTKVTVDNNGVITGIEQGTATITVTTEDGKFTDTCAVTVSAS